MRFSLISEFLEVHLSHIKNAFCAAALALFAGGASAAVIDFDGSSLGTHTGYVEEGFTFDKLRLVSASCASKPVQPCAAENAFVDTTMTHIGGNTFNVSSLWFSLVSTVSPFTLVTDKGTASFAIGDLLNGTVIQQGKGYILDLAANSLFANVSFLKIVDSSLGQAGTGKGKGNMRFDNIDVTANPAPVPVPAAGALLIGGLAGLATLRRRRKA